jgi:cytochrome P450
MEVLGNTVILTVEPDNLKAMLATQFSDFGLGLRHEQFYPLLGDGIFTLDGAGWTHSRALLRPQFARDQV